MLHLAPPRIYTAPCRLTSAVRLGGLLSIIFDPGLRHCLALASLDLDNPPSMAFAAVLRRTSLGDWCLAHDGNTDKAAGGEGGR